MTKSGRVDWVDYGKGICIILIVMMHSVGGVQEAAGEVGWLNHVVEFARPFRMPDFFVIAGLFLARVIDRDWKTYLDRKVVHFAYFYVLWLTIEFAFKAPGMASEGGWGHVGELYLLSFIDPFGALWFIYILPIFFVITKLLKAVPVWLVLPVLAALEILPVHTGWMVIDEFAARFVYFYIGYAFAQWIFSLASAVIARSGRAGILLGLWALANGALVWAGWATLPFVSLAMGIVGACAVVTMSALLSKVDAMGFVRYCGTNSIVIYLAFFLPMAVTRSILLSVGIIPDIGTVSLIVTAAGVIGPLVLFWIVRDTWFRWLFQRPGWARLKTGGAGQLAPAE